ncbi:hypothetical protein Leryth_002720 [Lithospermum erythrorhizon]|nr:hypothetical protein Leryth_002720 [Lithospermum erythrorhizon]
MAIRLLKSYPLLRSLSSYHLHLRIHSFVSIPTRISLDENKGSISSLSNDIYNLSLLVPDSDKNDLMNCKVELIDDETWNVSSSLAEAWRSNNNKMVNARRGRKVLLSEDDGGDEEAKDYLPPNKENPDLDEIEDMRIRGNLFYKLEKQSKEYEEHKFDFHRRKTLGKNHDKKEEKEQKKETRCPLVRGVEKVVKNGTGKGRNEMTKNETSRFKRLPLEDHDKKENLGLPSILDDENANLSDKTGYIVSRFDQVDGCNTKSKRMPTFNQVTAPYHEPFCLDIYVSKGSVRASVIHRVTSKVVAVAHSISKDLKFHLGSPKSRNACALVGKVLAQRAVDDDIYNMVYTPRKEEKLEGKLQIVLQAIIDGGVEVKVKLKQKKARKNHGSIIRTRQ